MTFKVLNELLNLREAGDSSEEPITAGVEKIAKDITSGVKTGSSAIASADSKNRQAKSDAEKADKEKEKQDKVDAVETRATGVKDKQQIVNDFLKQYFVRFPDLSSQSPQLTDKIATRTEALAMFKIFKNLSTELQSMRSGINKAAATKMSAASLKSAVDTADTIADGNNVAALRKTIKNFVRNEHNFFSKLISIDKDFDLKDVDFKDLLNRKLRSTDDMRFPDAVAALNILLAWMSHDLGLAAMSIRNKGAKLPAETKPKAED